MINKFHSGSTVIGFLNLFKNGSTVIWVVITGNGRGANGLKSFTAAALFQNCSTKGVFPLVLMMRRHMVPVFTVTARPTCLTSNV